MDTLFASVFLLLVNLASIDCRRQYCQIAWESGGHGEIPQFAVHAPSWSTSAEESSFIGRIFFHSAWLIGSVNETTGVITYAESDDKTSTSETYEVLTNPHNCVLSWVKAEGAVVPENSVQSYIDSEFEEVRNQMYYVGRSSHGKEQIVGTVMPDKHGIRVAVRDKYIFRNRYEVLVSTYPGLVAELTDFVFNIGPPDFAALEERFTKLELVGEDVILNSAKTTSKHSISHSKSFTQSIIVEEEYDWMDLEQVVMRLSLWFGNEDIEASTKISDGIKKWRIQRTHEAKIQLEVPVSGRESVQICSMAAVLDDPVIPFTATGTFYHPQLKGDHVTRILKERGRVVLSAEGDRITAQVSGVLSGRYFLRTFTHIVEKQEQVSCLSLFPKWAQTY